MCEECDDGNVISADGCTEKCKTEELYECRDGCSGPLCETEQHCAPALFGVDTQVFSCRVAANKWIVFWLGAAS